jgi:curved DNA-binding protein CbpA
VLQQADMAPVEVSDDYYAILEVPQTATVDIIKKNYHRLARLLHPDKNQNKPDATASFQLVSIVHIKNFSEAMND